MSDPIFDPEYWRGRVNEACVREEIHRSIFNGSKDEFNRVVADHCSKLSKIGSKDSILDVGCGYGRLIQMLPGHEGEYLGIDISPDLIDIAKRLHGETKNRHFVVGDARDLYPRFPKRYDWVVAIGLHNMIINHVGQKEWDLIEKALLDLAIKGTILISLP